MKPNKYVHTYEDGLGERDVFVNGKRVELCAYADTERGIARIHRIPSRLDKHKTRYLTKTIRGHVEVVFK